MFQSCRKQSCVCVCVCLCARAYVRARACVCSHYITKNADVTKEYIFQNFVQSQGTIAQQRYFYRVADKSLARPTSRCILFDGENISFDASLVICINNTNIPPIMLINRIYENQNLLTL
jgi:hypothetical protein